MTPNTTLADGTAVTPDHRDINPATGQQRGYVVLSADERAKGFVRPVRRSYVHLRCGALTTMSQAIAETYARDPGFYSGTFCTACRAHFPVGDEGEFVWDGTDEKVGGSVSGRHSQSEDTNVAEGEACQSGPERATPELYAPLMRDEDVARYAAFETPNPNPSLQEGALEELIGYLRNPPDGGYRYFGGPYCRERMAEAAQALTFLNNERDEREAGILDKADIWQARAEAAEATRDLFMSRAEAAESENRSLFTDLAKAKEECGAGAGCCHTAARLEQAEARAEALQQKNKDLEADRNEWRTQHQNLLSVREVDLANLSERIETASRMAAVNIRVASKFAGKNDDLKARAEALQAVIETQEDSIAKLERKVQHWQERAEALQAENERLSDEVVRLTDCGLEAEANELRAVEAAQRAEALRAENEALRAVEAAARDMPRRTPESGGASSVYMFHIVASHVWANDAALKKLDAARALTKGESDA